MLLFTKIPGKDKLGIALDSGTGDVAGCVKLAKDCVNLRFPYVYFLNDAKLFSPQHLPHDPK